MSIKLGTYKQATRNDRSITTRLLTLALKMTTLIKHEVVKVLEITCNLKTKSFM